MDFSEDPRRAQIEPMHEFMKVWAYWGKYHPIRYESMTYRIMCWLEDHNNHEVKENREKASRGEAVRIMERPDECELIAWKVEHYLKLLFQEGYRESVRRLRVYYLTDSQMPLHRVAKRIGVSARKVDEIVKDDLYRLSTVWKD